MNTNPINFDLKNADPKKAEDRLNEVAHRLSKAIASDDLRLYYQPVINVKNGELNSLETLCRWNDLELNTVTPDEFIAVAEARGLIIALGSVVLQQVIRDLPSILKRWPTIRIAINVSSIELEQEGFAKNIIASINESNANFANHFELEISESISTLNLPKVQSHLEKLKHAGISIALDDFTTANSNLGRLHTLPFDKIKLDRTFTHGLDDPLVQTLIKILVDLTNSENKTMVFEGVENSKQLNTLKRLGCNLAQGYFLGSPRPLEELDEMRINNEAFMKKQEEERVYRILSNQGDF